jgi:hypothetical protein
MRLSRLQKFILRNCLESRNNTCEKKALFGFYSSTQLRQNKIAIQVALQNSLDNLVAKDLIMAHGYKTARKWHISKIKLTAAGKKTIREILKSRQKKLPIK